MTPDHKGGVWLSGDAFQLRGLLVNARGDDLQTVTVQGVWTVSQPQFVSRDIGWMTDYRSLYQSIDGGTSWSRIDSPLLSSISCLHFKDVQNGWVGGSQGEIFRTTDGGQTWTKYSTGLNYEIKQVSFVDHLNGWADAFRSSLDSGLKRMRALLKTADGGQTWEVLSNGDADSPQSIKALFFVNRREGWAIDTWQNNIVHTVDGGKTWRIQQQRAGGGWNSLTFINAKEGWAAGADGIIHTSDGGETWEYQVKPESSLPGCHLEGGITFLDRKNGWAVCRSGGLRTTDGGDTWKPISKDWIGMVPSFDTIANETHHPVTRPSSHFKKPAEFAYTPVNATTAGPAITRATLVANSSELSSESSKGISFSSLAPDGKGGVWISGQVLYSGLLLHATPAVSPGLSSDLTSIKNLSFPTPASGWMIADGSVYSSRDHINWDKVEVGHQADELEKVYFFNDKRGWVFGKSGALYRTTDGGLNWQRQNSGTNYDIRQVQFVNALDGWATAANIKPGYESRVFLSTRDGGDHWTEIPRGNSAPVDRFWFVSDLEGWAVDYDNNIIHTTDRGRNWRVQRPSANDAFVSIHFVDSLHGWAAGDGVIHTSDGGATWQYQIPPSHRDGAKYFDQVYFSDSNHGWALGFFRVLFTSDGGKTWNPIAADWQESIFDKAHQQLSERKNHVAISNALGDGSQNVRRDFGDGRAGLSKQDTGEARVKQLLQTLEPDNTLRLFLQQGRRGDGIHHWWMDTMRTFGIRQATFEIKFEHRIRNTDVKIKDVTYLTTYYRYDTALKDNARLERIRATGLEQGLESEILSRARKFLTEQVKLRLRETCGTLYMNLLDDEVLPILDEPFEMEDCKSTETPSSSANGRQSATLTSSSGKMTFAGVPIASTEETTKAFPQSAALKVIPRIIGSQYCVGDAELDSLQLKIELTYVNTGNENLILYKGSDAVSREMVAKNLNDLEMKRFEVNSTITSIFSGDDNCYKGASPGRCFVILPPGGSYRTETVTGVFAVRGDARRIEGAVHSGNHFLQIELLSWRESNELAEELRSRWRRFGRLWFQTVTAEPFEIIIDRNRTLSDCP